MPLFQKGVDTNQEASENRSHRGNNYSLTNSRQFQVFFFFFSRFSLHIEGLNLRCQWNLTEQYKCCLKSVIVFWNLKSLNNLAEVTFQVLGDVWCKRQTMQIRIRAVKNHPKQRPGDAAPTPPLPPPNTNCKLSELRLSIHLRLFRNKSFSQKSKKKLSS